MIGPIAWADLLAYSAQIACVVAVGSLLPLILRIHAADVRYAYWRALVALCLVLPWLQTRQAATHSLETPASAIFPSITSSVELASTAAPQIDAFPWLRVAGALLLAGIVLRLVWVGVGLFRLRHLRTAGHEAPSCEEHNELQWMLRTRAQVRYVPGLAQPVTFGAWRPVVLLPESLRTQPGDIQRAVLCHELFHVQRRDWIWVLGEEAVRAAFWYHPGMWWLISRIRLSREELVDELTVAATGKRRAYIEALLAFADAAPVVPAAAFARRRHLFRRMVLISKEAAMSSRRVVLSGALMALIVIAGAWSAIGAFPLLSQAAGSAQPGSPPTPPRPSEPGVVERRAKPITPENPIPRRVYSVSPQYPAGISDTRALVGLRITIDESGRVAEARSTGLNVIGGDGNPFVRSAVDAVRQWQYEPPASGPIAFDLTISFPPDADPQVVGYGIPFPLSTVTQRFGPVPPAPPAPPGPAVAPASPAPPQPPTVPSLAAPPAPPAPPPPPPPPPPDVASDSPDWAKGALRVGNLVKPPRKIKDVSPQYPALAQAAQVAGRVVLEARIGPDGRVTNARVVQSVPLLDQSALDAVMQWEFEPTLLNGVPTPVLMAVTIDFSLS